MDPYYDPSQFVQQQQMPQPAMVPMPNPSQVNFGYLQNQQLMLMQSQSQISNALTTAQYNFHRDMQSVLQGTMAAGMAVYGAGHNVFSKANEHVYQDTLMNGGNYVLERSKWRDVAWASGLAGSDMGRALQIGGRRPEFLSGGEYQYQMARSSKMRMEELGDMAIGGAASALGMAGMSLGPGGIVGGMIAGTIIDQTIGKAVQPWLDVRAYKRDIREFAAMADFSSRAGQTRMTEEGAEELAGRFYSHDHTSLKYVPFIGGALSKRILPENKYNETFKKMTQLDLLRDIDPNDIDKIEKQVKSTATLIDKMAGLLHTTRDAVLQMKGKLSRLGFTDTQQNTALGSLNTFGLSTGFTSEYGMQLGQQFVQAGAQLGYYNINTPGAQFNYGLNETAAIKAGQEAGLISKNIDAGSLSMQRYANAANLMHTPWGMVVEKGGGNVGAAASYFASKGNGSLVLGMALEKTDFFGNRKNPFESFRNYMDTTYSALTGMGINGSDAFGFLINNAQDPNQAFEALSGLDQINFIQANMRKQEARRNQLGIGKNNGYYSSWRPEDLIGLASRNTNIDRMLRTVNPKNAWADDSRFSLQRAIGYTKNGSITQESGGLWDTYQQAKNDSEIKNFFHSYNRQIGSGNLISEDSTRENLINKIHSKYDKEYGKDLDAGQIVDTRLNDINQYNNSHNEYTGVAKDGFSLIWANSSFENRLKSLGSTSSDLLGFISNIDKKKWVSSSVDQKQYNYYWDALKGNGRLSQVLQEKMMSGHVEEAIKLLQSSSKQTDTKTYDKTNPAWDKDSITKTVIEQNIADSVSSEDLTSYKELKTNLITVKGTSAANKLGITDATSLNEQYKTLGQNNATMMKEGSNWLKVGKNREEYRNRLAVAMGGGPHAEEAADRIVRMISATGFSNEDNQNLIAKVMKGEYGKVDSAEAEEKIFNRDSPEIAAIKEWTECCKALTAAIAGPQPPNNFSGKRAGE